MRRVRIGFVWLSAAVLLGAVTGAHADDPFYKGKRLTILINFAVGGPTDIEGRLFAKHLARHIDGTPGIVVQNMDGAGGVVGAKYLGEVGAARRHHGGLFHRHGLHLRARSGALPRRLQDLRVRRDPAGHHGAFRPHRRAARHARAGRYRQGQGPRARRAERRHAEGHPPAAGDGHARRAVQIRHRLSLEPAGAARLPARRDQLLFGIAAELPQRGRAHLGEDRAGDTGVLRRGLRRQGLLRAGSHQGPDDAELPRTVPTDQRHHAVRQISGTSTRRSSAPTASCSA